MLNLNVSVALQHYRDPDSRDFMDDCQLRRVEIVGETFIMWLDKSLYSLAGTFLASFSMRPCKSRMFNNFSPYELWTLVSMYLFFIYYTNKPVS